MLVEFAVQLAYWSRHRIALGSDIASYARLQIVWLQFKLPSFRLLQPPHCQHKVPYSEGVCVFQGKNRSSLAAYTTTRWVCVPLLLKKNTSFPSLLEPLFDKQHFVFSFNFGDSKTKAELKPDSTCNNVHIEKKTKKNRIQHDTTLNKTECFFTWGQSSRRKNCKNCYWPAPELGFGCVPNLTLFPL